VTTSGKLTGKTSTGNLPVKYRSLISNLLVNLPKHLFRVEHHIG